MIKREELGCPGHFICAKDCHWRRHTQIGKYRVSTVGDLYFKHEGDKRQTVGAAEDSFFEPMVFELSDHAMENNEGCGCREPVSFSEIDGERYATAGAAQTGHERYVEKYLRLQVHGRAA